MEYYSEISNNAKTSLYEDNINNIHISLCGDNTTTFSSDELLFSRIYNDVVGHNDESEKSRQQCQLDLLKQMGCDSTKKNEHPSKEFIIQGNLKYLVKNRIEAHTKKMVNNGQAIIPGMGIMQFKNN